MAIDGWLNAGDTAYFCAVFPAANGQWQTGLSPTIDIALNNNTPLLVSDAAMSAHASISGLYIYGYVAASAGIYFAKAKDASNGHAPVSMVVGLGTGALEATSQEILTELDQFVLTSDNIAFVAQSSTVTTGTPTGTYANTQIHGTDYYSFVPVAGAIDFYLSFNIGTDRTPTTATIHGRLTEAAPPYPDSIDMDAYNFNTLSWDHVSPVAGDFVHSVEDVTKQLTFNANHVDGSGNVQVRFYGSALTAGTVFYLNYIGIAGAVDFSAVADIPAILADTNELQLNQGNWITADVANLDVAVSTRLAAADYDIGAISDAVWDEILTGATHNIATSAGRRLRELASQVVWTGIAQGHGADNNQIILDTSASSVDGSYDPSQIAIVGGTGAGQCRLILDYIGSSRIATVDRGWRVQPDSTSEFIIYSHPGREHVNEGLIPAATADTVTLNASASSLDDNYIGQIIYIRSGTGEDQARIITDYDGTTKIANIHKSWGIIPDTTTAYIIIPGQVQLDYATSTEIAALNDTTAQEVWEYVERTLTGTGTITQEQFNDLMAGYFDSLPGGTQPGLVEPPSNTSLVRVFAYLFDNEDTAITTITPVIKIIGAYFYNDKTYTFEADKYNYSAGTLYFDVPEYCKISLLVPLAGDDLRVSGYVGAGGTTINAKELYNEDQTPE